MLDKTLFLLFILFSTQIAFSQTSGDMDLDKVSVEKGFINVWLKAVEDGKPIELNKNDIQLIESFKGQADTFKEIYSLEKSLVLDTIDIEQYAILFLVDVSRKIKKVHAEQAKQMIKEIVSKYSMTTNADFYLTTFNEQRIINRRRLSANNIEESTEDIIAEDKAADFDRTLIEEIRFLKGETGKKVLFVIGSGFNEIKGIEDYRNLLPYDDEDVKRQIHDLEKDDFVIFSIGQGESVNYDGLRDLVKGSNYITENELPKGYDDILKDNIIIHSTHLAKVTPSKPVYQGEKRNYTALVKNKSSSTYSLRLGTILYPISILSSPDWLIWAMWFLLGTIIIITILGICSILVPILQKKKFLKTYVFKYAQEGAVRLNDPVYMEPIKSGELIVRKCQQVVPLSTWEDIGGQCPNFPDCMDPQFLGCNGAGGPTEDSFFSRKGMFRLLNWMWYGALGGFLAWILIAFFNLIEFQGIKTIISKLLPADKLTAISDIDLSDDNIYQLLLNSLSNDLLLGIAFGTGIVLMLSYIVELSESRQFQWSTLIKRTILRAFLGMLVSILIFFSGFYLQYGGILPNPYASGLLTWLLFGIAVGVILSINSNIDLARGIWGGLLAALIAYNVYFAIAILFSNFVGAKLISLIVLGAVLGFVLVSVISRLENFELEFIAPKRIENIPISKWLKNDQTILIGKEPGSYVYIKWDDPAVMTQHARLLLENGVVFIQPLAETLVNRKIIPVGKKSPLANKDLIQLGRESTTLIRYKEKRVANNGIAK